MENLVRKRIVNIGKIGIGLGLLIFLIYYIDPTTIKETFLKANRFYFFIAFLLLPLNLFLQYYKWKVLSSKYFGIKDSGKIWLSLFYGISGGIFTPMKSGEYFARSLPYNNVKVLDVILTTLVDKLIPIFFVIIIGGAFFIIYLEGLIGFSIFVTSVLIVLSSLLVYFLLHLLFGRSKTSIKLRGWLQSKKIFAKVLDRISFLKDMDRRTLVKLVAASFFYHITFTTQMALLLSAFSGEFNFILFFFAANLIIFTQIVIPPIAFGEVGVREGASVYFLQNLGFVGAVGFNAAISLFFINLLLPSVVGFLLLLKRS
ncbi:MAG: flippase-like domain-containing protein [Melioribacteraceae bacterium]|nr:flippase-like domain-containing protein [Melioribacteraceae bacterium]